METSIDTESARFRAWFGKSRVTDGGGAPLLVFRGEHGRRGEGMFQTRGGAITFADRDAAIGYATSPNDRADSVHEARVMPAYLRIERPFMLEPADPYLELQTVAEALGRAEATRVALKFETWIRDTDNWRRIRDEVGPVSVSAFLKRHPDRLADLYFLAYPYLDDPAETARLKAAGFDGAVHAGSSVTAGKAEYKVFGTAGVLPAAPRWLAPEEVREFAAAPAPAMAP